MSSAHDTMRDRLRDLLIHLPPMTEKRMIGGTCYVLRGNMAFGATSRGDLLLRVSPDDDAEFLQQNGVSRMQMGGRPMLGYIAVAPAVLSDEAALLRWISHALKHAEALPPK
jgi:TfoX/Sxy family transcriptional regulator of competence genes